MCFITVQSYLMIMLIWPLCMEPCPFQIAKLNVPAITLTARPRFLNNFVSNKAKFVSSVTLLIWFCDFWNRTLWLHDFCDCFANSQMPFLILQPYRLLRLIWFCDCTDISLPNCMYKRDPSYLRQWRKRHPDRRTLLLGQQTWCPEDLDWK